MKCISFDEYKEMEILMSGKNMSKIFNAAWKNTEDGKKQEKIKGIIISALISTLFAKIVTDYYMLVPLAGVNEIIELQDTNPNFLSKMKDAFEMYKNTIDILNIGHDKEIFLDIMKGFFNKLELFRLVDVCKGAKLDEIMELLPKLLSK